MSPTLGTQRYAYNFLITNGVRRTHDGTRGEPLALSPGVRLASLCAKRGVTESTANEHLLHHSSVSLVS